MFIVVCLETFNKFLIGRSSTDLKQIYLVIEIAQVKGKAQLKTL